MGKNNLRMGINKYHGGLNAVRKKMGYEFSKRPNGYLENWDNFKTELEKAIKLNSGKFPSQNDLAKIGFSSLYHYFDCFGGVYKVMEKVGFESKTKPRGYWKKWKNFEPEMQKAISENNGEFPTNNQLIKMGKGRLSGAILYHGGFPAVREKIGYNEQIINKLAKDLEEVVERMVG